MQIDKSIEWSSQALSLWAKSGDKNDEESGGLTLPQHLIDSAAVAETLWDTWVSPRTKEYLCGSLQLSAPECRQLLAWLAGTHDIGKASRPFALMLDAIPKYQHLAREIEDAGLDLRRPIAQSEKYHHTVVGQVIVSAWLAERFGVSKRVAIRLAAIAGAHHGLPAFQGDLSRARRDLMEKHGPLWRQVHGEILSNITELTEAGPVLALMMTTKRPISTDVQMILTGLVIMIDWIASNSEAFPMVPGAKYDPERVARGVAAVGLTSPWQALDHRRQTPQQAYQQSFNWPPSRIPRPMQETVMEVALTCDSPTLMCIEAPMGNGKTEAALLAAEILAAVFHSSGIMFAAPTMATSDALFSRVIRWVRRASGDNVMSTYLGHSKNAFNQEFRSLPRADSIRTHDDDDKEHVVAHEWLWGRKKGILANMVVGTVDQVLVMALQSKHAMLRHLGLSGKVVVIDEVHAYDVYMSSYLAKALHWLGTYGVPVILLSATLPHGIKAELMAAYWDGVDRTRAHAIADIPDSGTAYPVISTVSQKGTELIEVEPEKNQLKVSMSAIADDEWSDVIAPVIDHGGCVLIICSTVGRAQETYLQAKKMVGEDARLLHARFTASERVEAERTLVDELGPDSVRGDGRPRRRVVVATQVVEQSLDLDFDLIITDIAPIDLLLQRAGRLHRHSRPQTDRPQWLKQPQLYVRGIDQAGDISAEAPTFSGSIEAIYPRSLLIETYLALGLGKGPSTLSLPADIPVLVQQVYGGHVQIPPGWEEDFTKAQNESEKKRGCAQSRAQTFQFGNPSYNGSFADLWKNQTSDIGKNGQAEARGFAQVRDADPTLEVVLCQRTGSGTYRPLPWIGQGYEGVELYEGQIPDHNAALDIATSSVRLPYRFSSPRLFDKALDELERRTDLAWLDSGFLRGQLQLMLDQDYRTELAGYPLRYDQELGLIDETTQEPATGYND